MPDELAWDNPGAQTDPPAIPDKLYFRIGEVSRLVGVKPYVLRYWESEFPMLEPRKSGSGHRLFRRKDVELLLEIKRLLYEKRYTIEGARQLLEQTYKHKKQRLEPPPRKQATLFRDVQPEVLDFVRKELHELLDILR